jgi:hypothetical protein
MQFDYIYYKDYGTYFDRYFEYLSGGAAAAMPAALAEFAQDIGRYELNGSRTLHDAWLMGIDVDKVLVLDQRVETTCTIRLLHAMHENDILIRYDDVSAIAMSLEPDSRLGRPVDLLVHEVTVRKGGTFRHAIQFDRGVYIDVSFRGFAIEDVART